MPQQNGKKKIKKGFNFYWIYIILFAVFIAISFSGNYWEPKSFDISLFELKKMLLHDDVKEIQVVNDEYAEIIIKTDRIYQDTVYNRLRSKDGKSNEKYYEYKFLTLDQFQKDLDNIHAEMITRDTIGKAESEKIQILNRPFVEPTPVKRRNVMDDMMSFLWPVLILVVIWIVFARMMSRNAGGGGAGGGIFNFGKSKAQLFDKNNSTTVTFKDVAGLAEAKVEVMEIVDFLKNPKKYTDLGGKIPKGALLVGPPGTGKTLLAKAVAGEARVPFFSISGSDFVEMFVGVGASRVRDLFKTAKEKAPCIIFIDEIDAVGRARGRSAFSGSNDERENTLNQLLTEMDGFGTNSGVIILAATNRADILDRALLRAGRFDRQIMVNLPEQEERVEIFKVHLRPIKLAKDVDILFLSKQTPGFSGADIANVCNEAALIAARKDKKEVNRQDFLDAVDRIVGGLERRSMFISPKEKKVIAYHESGHASVSWLLEHAHPLVKVTIVPRGRSLGAAWYLPEERQITTIEQMYDEMTSALAGRAAEQVVFGTISTGALSDLEKITKQAYAMVAYFGLNDKVGNLSYYDSSGEQEFQFQRPYSEKTAELIDKEVHELVERAYQRALKLIEDNKDKLDALAKVLLEKEVIFREDLEMIFGPRPFEKDQELLSKEKAQRAAEEQQTSESSAMLDKDQTANELTV